MLTQFSLGLGHIGLPIAPHDILTVWNLGAGLLILTVIAGWFLIRGPRVSKRRSRFFIAGMWVIVLAVVSPLSAMAGSLASAHMIQHLLLTILAAPLLALAAPLEALLTGLPIAFRRWIGGTRRRARLTPAVSSSVGMAVTATVVHVGTVWALHASVIYDATLANEFMHHLGHLLFLVPAVAFWSVVVRNRRVGDAASPVATVLLIFGAMMANVMLAVLITFSTSSWYEGYRATTAMWGLTPLADQQLSGVIMWVPPTVVYLGVALRRLVTALHDSDEESLAGADR